MNNIFGIINRPTFDPSFFKVNQAINVVDYNNRQTEYPGIIVAVNLTFIDILYYDDLSSKAVFTAISIEEFINGDYELKPLVPKDLEDYRSNTCNDSNEVADFDLSIVNEPSSEDEITDSINCHLESSGISNELEDNVWKKEEIKIDEVVKK